MRPSLKRDIQMETLVGALEGDILVHNHCYRADEMAQIIDLSKEFGYQVTAFHHAVEAYKIGDLLPKITFAQRCGRIGGGSN